MESPLWKFNAEWGWVVGNSWRPILAQGGGGVHAGSPADRYLR